MVAEPDALVTARQCAAAVVIQSTYRGYRARRKLADAAIMSKPVGWWNLLDAVVLQEHTQHYYAHSKSWKARENWQRLKRKASKVGKGLEKDHKALKLALQHWLEAVDARHRYGHNLRPYYLHWLALDTSEPFFYWLDLGAGRQVELPKCSRAKLQEQQIKYLSPEQRRHYEVAIYHGKLFYKVSGELVHTGSAKNDRWIFVLSPSDRLYIGRKQPGVIQHSSFLAGGATVAAGRLVVEHGILKLMEAHSGHYRPSPENFEALVQRLVQSGADLHLAKVQLVSDDMIEKKEGKQLAGEVRAGIENAGAEGRVAVKIADQKLVTVDSGPAGRPSEYLVTNMTFSKSNDTTAQNHAAAEDLAAKDAADRVSKEQLSNNEATVPEEPANDQAPLPAAAQEDEHKQPPTLKATVDQKPPALEDLCIAKQEPGALVLPPVGAMSSLNPNRPKTPSVPTSPGFSRIASLAELERQDRRQALKKYGPEKSGLGTPKKGRPTS